jgi:glycosyltransferase involved in cell wall biosynthesis
MKKLTIAILTYNEEINIKEVIENSLKCTDDVLIIDSGSNDGTVKIAEELGARVVFRTWDDDFAAQRNFALLHTTSEWILYLDADERLNNEVIEKIKVIVKSGKMNKQYFFKRKTTAFAREFDYGVLYPDFVFRMFPTNKVRWINKVHERPICDLKKELLPGYIKHYTYRSLEQLENKYSQYATIWAKDSFENGKRTTLLGAISHAFFAFIKTFFIKRGFLEGEMGFVLCCNYYNYTLMKYSKLYEIEKNHLSFFLY